MSLDIAGYRAPGPSNQSTPVSPSVEQRGLVRPFLAQHIGREFKTKPEYFLVEFPSPLDAARCASDIQKMINEYNTCAPPKLRISIRIGIHLGDLIRPQGGISGDAVSVPLSITKYESICLTRSVFDQLGTKFRRPLQSLGTRSVKGTSGPVELFKVVLPWEEDKEAGKGFERTKIAVLPFANNSPNPMDDYFADGFTGQLISTMSSIGGLKVIGRTSVMPYRSGSGRLDQVGRELEVGTVLEGSVRKTRDRLEITTELVDSSTTERLWGETLDRPLREILTVAGEIAQTVAEELKVRFSAREKVLFARKRTVNPDAYSRYLEGRFNLNHSTQVSVDRAVRSFKQAVHIDPEFALGYAGLADCFNIQVDQRWTTPGLAVSQAKTSAVKALEIDPSIGEAHAALAHVLAEHYWEFATAENEFKRAITLNPSYAPAHHWYGTMLLHTRRYEEAYQEEKQALEYDPHSPAINIRMATLLATLGRTSEALERYRQLLELGKDYADCHAFKSILHASLSQGEAAIQEARNALDYAKSPFNQSILGWAFAAADRREETEKVFVQMMKGTASEPISPTWMAVVAFQLGKQDEAFRMLEKALIVKDPDILEFASLPWFNNCRQDPRWERMETRLGLAIPSSRRTRMPN